VKLPPRSPNLNAHAERFVRTIKESCLKRMILFGESAERKASAEFIGALPYHSERNHQGLYNAMICLGPEHVGGENEVHRRGRLGQSALMWTIERGIDRQPEHGYIPYRSDCTEHFGSAQDRTGRCFGH
jgi:transposase InsO family protein